MALHSELRGDILYCHIWTTGMYTVSDEVADIHAHTVIRYTSLVPGSLSSLINQSLYMCEGESLGTRPGTHTSASFLVQARPACSLQCVLMMSFPVCRDPPPHIPTSTHHLLTYPPPHITTPHPPPHHHPTYPPPHITSPHTHIPTSTHTHLLTSPPTSPHAHLHTSPPHITTYTHHHSTSPHIYIYIYIYIYPPPHITTPHSHLHISPPHLPSSHITTPPPHIPTLIIQYLLLWLRGRARAECPGLGRWRFRSLCLRMEGGVTVTGVQLAIFTLGGSADCSSVALTKSDNSRVTLVRTQRSSTKVT